MAAEHWILARKPLIGTVAANAQEYGTGAINIDGCRIDLNGSPKTSGGCAGSTALHEGGIISRAKEDNTQGRWPANVTLDEEAAAALDAQTGNVGAHGGSGNYRQHTWMVDATPMNVKRDDTGGASRFFYVAKPSTKERDAGLEALPLKPCGMMEDDNYAIKTGSGNLRDTQRRNTHPTVKPIALMRYLCRLITPPGGIVLDPFMGSGTTGCAAIAEGFAFIGIEQSADYCAIARNRIAAAAQQPALEMIA
jgi:site-specific DNA-methyltransferase (adenine-specific)